MSDQESQSDLTNGETQPAKSSDAAPKETGEDKLIARLKGIDCFREKRAAHPDDAVAQIGQMIADVLEMQARMGHFVRTCLRGHVRIWESYDPITVTIGLVRQSAQLFKLERELCDKLAASRTNLPRGESPSE